MAPLSQVKNVPNAVTKWYVRKGAQRVLNAATANVRNMQLEFPFMMHVRGWDGQYTFTHWIAKQCFNEAAKGAKTQAEKDAFDLGPFKEYEIRVWGLRF